MSSLKKGMLTGRVDDEQPVRARFGNDLRRAGEQVLFIGQGRGVAKVRGDRGGGNTGDSGCSRGGCEHFDEQRGRCVGIGAFELNEFAGDPRRGDIHEFFQRNTLPDHTDIFRQAMAWAVSNGT